MVAEKKFHPSVYISIWITFSSSVILYNKWILSSAGFHYPIFLTTWHLVFATVLTRIMKMYTTLLPAAKNSNMSWETYLRSVVPIGVFFSGSLIFNNLAYLHLSVAFIQMLKATTPIVVLVFSFMSGLKEPNLKLFLNVLIVVVGVAIASYGELEFQWNGFVYQVTGILFESSRLVLVQKLMTEKMDPLSSLYFFAPVCAFFNFFAFLIYEYPVISLSDITGLGFSVLLSNAMVAFGLNVAVVFLIGCTSSLVLTLSGVLKDILLIAFSMIMFHSRTTMTQVFGYSIALVALVKYKTTNMDLRKEYQRLFGKDGTTYLPK
ncbi:triose-phosphate transporter [Paraphysoderma sedebokerense]|nr:triose-phosphate transporter [Paraphysoderma sedebokerense]